MAEFHARSESVNVEQIMEQIRARIREKRGDDYVDAEIRSVAAAKMERLLGRPAAGDAAPAAETPLALPNFTFEEQTLFESTRAPLRAIRRLLLPILKLFFNPNPLIRALHLQSRLNAELVAREERRQQQARVHDQQQHELLRNVILEMAKTTVELKTLRMRVESMTGRLEFAEGRTRALEGAVLYRPADSSERDSRDQRGDRGRDGRNREMRDVRDSREPRESRDGREGRDRDGRDREAREREAREREGRDREAREREARERDGRERESREPRDRDGRDRDSREQPRDRERPPTPEHPELAASGAPSADSANTGTATPASGAGSEGSGRRRRRRRRGRRGAGSGAPGAAPESGQPIDHRLTRPEPFEQAFGANAHPFESATADPAHLSDEFADGEEIEETAENPAKPGSGSEPEREAVALPPATAPAPATIDTSAAQQAVDPAAAPIPTPPAAPIPTPRADTASSPGADSDAAASLDQHRPAEPHIVEPQSGSADASVAASDDPSDAADDHHQ